MGSVIVIESEVVSQAVDAPKDVLVFFEIDFFVFDRAPQPFHKDVVEDSALPVHTDPDTSAEKQSCKIPAGKLGALIGVENLWFGLAESSFQSFHTEVNIQGDGDRPSEDIAAVPVHDRHQVDEPPMHPYVSDITCPHLIRSVNIKPSEKIWEDFVFIISPAQLPFWINCLDAHQTHQTTNPLVIDMVSLAPKPYRHSPRAIEWGARVLLINQPC
jgi:hypothetical protein